MATVSHRVERLADQVRSLVAELIASELRDPRIGFTTVTRVELSADLQHARILVSVLGDEEAQRGTLEGLASAGGYIRRELSGVLRLRRTAVAEFREARSVTLEKLQAALDAGQLGDPIIPLERLLPECPELVVRGREEQSVRYGRPFELAQIFNPQRGMRPGRAPAMAVLKVLDANRRLIAVARHVSGSIYHPDLVLV